MLDRLRRDLASGLESPVRARQKLAAVRDFRRGIRDILIALWRNVAGTGRRVLATAYGRGQQAAVAELGALGIGGAAVARAVLPGAPVVDRLAAAVIHDLTTPEQGILRQLGDVYRAVIVTSTPVAVRYRCWSKAFFWVYWVDVSSGGGCS